MELLVGGTEAVFLFSAECRRGGILGGNGQRSHRLVPLRLRGRGDQRQPIRYNSTVELYCILSAFALLVIVFLVLISLKVFINPGG